MFRIVCFVEDKALPKVLHAVAGLVVNMEPPQPVTNVTISKPSKGTAKLEQSSTATSIKGRLIEYLETVKGSRLNMDDMRAKWTEFGGMESGVNGSLTTQLIEEKHLKRISRGLYVAT